jgi:2-methylcitrate dehydratase
LKLKSLRTLRLCGESCLFYFGCGDGGFTFGLRYDSIPAEVVAAARRHLADTMACALGAHKTEAASLLQKYGIDKGDRANATIIGTDKKVPAGLAALVNGT